MSGTLNEWNEKFNRNCFCSRCFGNHYVLFCRKEKCDVCGALDHYDLIINPDDPLYINEKNKKCLQIIKTDFVNCGVGVFGYMSGGYESDNESEENEEI